MVSHVPMAYPNTTKQKIPPVYPRLMPVKGVDGKFDFFHQVPDFAKAGLCSIGIPQKLRWCHTICIQVWCEFERAKILLRTVAGFNGITSSLVSYRLIRARNSPFGRTGGNLVKIFLVSHVPMAYTLPQPSKKVHWSTPFRRRSKG